MTLIVGIKCTDGVVIAADGAATFGSLGQQTIRQPTQKLEILHGCYIMGVSGFVGLGQRLFAAVKDACDNGALSKKKPHEVQVRIADAMRQHVKPELEMATVARGAIGQHALSSAITYTLLAGPCNDGSLLIQFDQQCAGEEATAKLPFVSIGSGQGMADPFLAFLRKVFWPDRLPSLADGTFAAVWTVKHAIDAHPGGVAEPLQVIRLEKDAQKKWRAHELTKDELDDHARMVAEAEAHLKEFPQKFHGAGLDNVQEPPEPSA